MDAPRLTRLDLRVMQGFDGEHFPVEVDVETGSYDAATGMAGEITGAERQIRCGCTEALQHDWGDPPHAP